MGRLAPSRLAAYRDVATASPTRSQSEVSSQDEPVGQPDKGYPGRMNASVFRFLLRAGVALLVLTAMARVAAATGGDGWPTLSHDAQRTARSTGTGVITAAPTVAWQRIMGGALGSRQLLTADVDGDGKTEALLVSAGRVVARKDNNGQLWASPHIGAFAVIAVANLDGKGGDELVARLVFVRRQDRCATLVCCHHELGCPGARGCFRRRVPCALG